MQQHGGRPQGECPSPLARQARAIHQLPAPLVTTNMQQGKWPAQQTHSTGLFLPKPRNVDVDLLVLFHNDSYLGI